MLNRELMKGNEALAEAAIRAGCLHYYGYPITPQTELLEYMARELPERGGTFLQTESEIAGIFMVYGTAATGKRVMTSSSGPGWSLMSEGVAYLSTAQLPAVLVDVSRAGPALGRITAAQGDYNYLVKGVAPGDIQMLVLAPAYVQEIVDLTFLAFDLADKYRVVVTIAMDAMLGQLMESFAWPEWRSIQVDKSWAVTGAKGRPHNWVINNRVTEAEWMDLHKRLKENYERIAAAEQRWECLSMDDAELAVVAYGTSARIAMDAIDEARQDGIPVGLIRPITLWPFPTKGFEPYRGRLKGLLAVEMSNGQMVADVELAMRCTAPVQFHGQGGAWIPSTAGIREEIERLWHSVR